MRAKEILFSFEGRISRSTYWGYGLMLLPIWGGGWLIDLAVHGEQGLFYWLGILLCFWPGLAISVKRCHDRNRSGWFCLVAMIPFVSLWYMVEVGFLPGTAGPNRFGQLDGRIRVRFRNSP